MNPSQLFSEVARQNKLLKETITSFQFSLESDNEDPERFHHSDREDDELSSNLSYISTSSPTLSSSSSSSNHSSVSSIQQTRIETLIDLLDKQESRLNLLEEFGREVLMNSSIPIFRGIKKSKENPNEIQIQEWCEMISNRLNSLKSINRFSLNSKSFLRFIFDHLDLKPLKLIINLLERNKSLIDLNFPDQIPVKFQNQSCLKENELSDLLEYPFKLHVLRHPRALLNLLQSKFTELDQRPTSLKDLNRIEIKPGDSLLLR